jgi:penicillin-binding protein 1A
MVSAYTAFANHGIRTAPLFVTRIEDAEGNVLANFSPQVDEVISEESSFKMLTMLRAVINEGTGGRIRRVFGIQADMGGKTGTTNNNSDGWFMGFTPSLVSGVWVGGEERDIHFDRMADGQGAEMALPIWGLYMQKVYKDKSLGYSESERFQIPDGFDPCGDSLSNSYSPDAPTYGNNGHVGLDEDLFE